MPLIRRLPKRGFSNAAFHQNYAIINLTDLNRFKAGTVVNEKLLRESKLVRGDVAGIKILGEGELKHALTIEADKVSASAQEKIDKAGGTITLRNGRATKPVESDNVDSTMQEKPAEAPTEPTAKKRSTTTTRAKRKKKSLRER